MKHSVWYIILVVATWLVFVVTMFFNLMSGWDAETVNLGLFLNNTGDVSDRFYIEITPASWTFSIWGVIYIFQVLWLIYATTTLFRKSSDGPLYMIAPYIHWSIYVIFMFNNLCNIAWLLLWDRQHIIPALLPIALTAFTMYLLLIISIHGIYKYHGVLVSSGFRYENRWVIALLHNGFGIYGAWVTIATLLNFAIVLAYSAGLPQHISSTAALGVLTFDMMVFVLIDLCFFERYTRFLFTPYLVLIVALIGSISKNYDELNSNTVFTISLLVPAVVLFLLKIGLVSYREKRNPAFTDGDFSPKQTTFG